MAKLTDRQKQNIIAKFKTGQYSKRELAKKYKVDEKTIRVITEGHTHENAHIVEAFAKANALKKSAQSPQEIAAIVQAVKELEMKDEIEELTLKATLENVKAIKEKIKKGFNHISTPLGVTAVSMTTKDYKDAQDALDKALITAGKAPRHAPRGDITLNNNENNIKAHIEYIVEMPVELKPEEVEIIEVIPRDNEE